MMREMRWLMIVLVACSSKAPSPTTQPTVEPKPVAAACVDTVLGGYDGTPECKATAETPIRAADLRCTANEDCIRLGPHERAR
jgi:hypothetical protein